MPRPPSHHQSQDMYWFAHGGVEGSEIPAKETTVSEPDEETVPDGKCIQDRSSLPEELPATIAKNTSLDKQDSAFRASQSAKRLAVEEHKRQIQAAEQEKSEAILKKHAEREAALEAKRNAQRNNMSYAFGASLPPKMEFDIVPVQLSAAVATTAIQNQPSKPAVNLMTQSMTASMIMSTSSNGTRGRRKNDLTPTVLYDRTSASQRSASSVTRKRSVSMSRLDQLALPRKSYVEAQKNNPRKDQFQSPKRPLSSASEKSSRSNRVPSTTVVSRRPQTSSVRKPRPVSIAGSVPDQRTQSAKPSVPPKRVPLQKKVESQKANATGDAVAPKKSQTKPRSAPNRDSSDKSKSSSPASSTKNISSRPPLKNVACRQSTPKTSPARKLLTNKKKDAILAAAAVASDGVIVSGNDEVAKVMDSPAQSSMDEDSLSADDKSCSKQHIISEEEAKVALAEKRRLAREQAEKEAELERQRQEELQREEEKRLQLEEEEQKRLEEEQLRLLEEHKRFEEEKLQKAIEEQEKKDVDEKNKREEEAKVKLEQEKKAKEEAEKQRIELEEKLKKEEEERAERKKRLDKIMSRTRGKSGTASPSGSLNGSDPPDSIENHPLSSDPSSLDSNEPQVEQCSPTESFNINETLLLASQSLSSNDLMLPSSGHTSLDANEPMSLESQKELNENNESSPLEDLVSVDDVPLEMTTSMYGGDVQEVLLKAPSDEEEQLTDNRSESVDSQAGMDESLVEQQLSATVQSKPSSIPVHSQKDSIDKLDTIEVHSDVIDAPTTTSSNQIADLLDQNQLIVEDPKSSPGMFAEVQPVNEMINEFNKIEKVQSTDYNDYNNEQLIDNYVPNSEVINEASDILPANSYDGLGQEIQQSTTVEEIQSLDSSDEESSNSQVDTSDIVPKNETPLAKDLESVKSGIHTETTNQPENANNIQIDLNISSSDQAVFDDRITNLQDDTNCGLKQSLSESNEFHCNSHDITPFKEAETYPSYDLKGNQHIMSFADSPNRDFDSSDDNINYCGVKSVTVAEINCQGVDYFQQVEYDPVEVKEQDNEAKTFVNVESMSSYNDSQSIVGVIESDPFNTTAAPISDNNPFGSSTDQLFTLPSTDQGHTNNPFFATDTENSINSNIFSVEGFDSFTHDSICDQTLNPFGNELIMRSSIVGPIAEESEESSLDSNLSQVLNVNTGEDANWATAKSGLSNGQNAFCDIEDGLNSHECNGSVTENRILSADSKADQLSSSSEKLPQYLADNGNFNIFDLDHTNSNNVSANPFVESAEKTFSTNLF